MNAAEAIASHTAFINEVGETVYVRRFSGTPPTLTIANTATTARVVGCRTNPLLGPITEGDRDVIALVDDLSGILPLTTNDALVVRGKEMIIKAIDDNTRRIGGTLVALEIRIGG
jgi:hypothetical protein